MTKFTDTQSLILRRASTRPSNIALPLPERLRGAAAKKVVTMMITRGWLAEFEVNICRKEPVWREIGDGHGITLIATGGGLEPIGIEPDVAKSMAEARPAPGEKEAEKPVTRRASTKQAVLVDMLRAKAGATIDEIVAATGWQFHSIRGAISGVLKKKLGLTVTSEKVEGRGRGYRIG